MKAYELLFIVDGSLTDEVKDQAIEKVKALIEKTNGNISTVDKWGMRKLAYPINYKSEGFYCLINFEAGVDAPKTIGEALRIQDGIVRFMIVNK